MSWINAENKLSQVLKFSNQSQLAEFLLKIAHIADNMNHHPDYIIRKCSELEISLTTHDKHKITHKDVALAEIIDKELINFGRSI